MTANSSKGRGASRQVGVDSLTPKLAAACGRNCATCDAYRQGSCSGCGSEAGSARHDECPVLACAVTVRNLEHCGLCLDLPCQTFISHAPPLEVARLYKALRRRADIGTPAWLAEQP